ncbi:MAG: exopolysaccharide biosynthesis protein [Patescibacteria group bacterium]|nr:exopolysaccharide biosynthesis protein [Patescibacteria group bacterium]
MITFSQKLQTFFDSQQPKTLQSLIENFAEKSFALLFLILLAVPALPLPTGGITHIFEIIAMLLALELLIGRTTIWLPQSWLRKTVPIKPKSSALARFIKVIAWIEKYSRPRLTSVQTSKLYLRLLAVVILVFTVFAFLAPPFSGLDTLPSLGVVLVSLALILGDSLLTIIGVMVGSVGIGLILLLGRTVFRIL